jgi:hypothetical protein
MLQSTFALNARETFLFYTWSYDGAGQVIRFCFAPRKVAFFFFSLIFLFIYPFFQYTFFLLISSIFDQQKAKNKKDTWS